MDSNMKKDRYKIMNTYVNVVSMYNEFDQNITKESDPVRQKHYTMKKH